MTESINQLMNDKAVCRTAPATPGLLISDVQVCPLVLMTGLTIRVTSVHLSAICAYKQQYVPRLKI